MICRTSEHYVLYYYVKPYTRYGPFLIGILTGIYLTTKKDQLLKQKVRTFDYLPQSLHTAKSSSRNTKHITDTICFLAVAPVAGSTWLVLLFIYHGCVGWIGLRPQGDPGLSICATCPLPGSAQTTLGPGCDLDHTSL